MFKRWCERGIMLSGNEDRIGWQSRDSLRYYPALGNVFGKWRGRGGGESLEPRVAHTPTEIPKMSLAVLA